MSARGNPFLSPPRRRSAKLYLVLGFFAIFAWQLVSGRSLLGAIGWTVVTAMGLEVLSRLASRRARLAVFLAFAGPVLLSAVSNRHVDSLRESATPKPVVSQILGDQRPGARGSLSVHQAAQAHSCNLLCTPEDPDFEEFYRYDSLNIPHCRRNVPSWLKREMKQRAGIRPDRWDGYVIDHVIPLSLGGSNCRSNLQVLSEEDHRDKGRLEERLREELGAGEISYRSVLAQLLCWRPR